MAKQKEDFGPFKPFFQLYQKMKPAKNITYTVTEIWKIFTKKNKGLSPIKYDFPTVIHKTGKTWFRDKVAIFQDFAWFFLFGPRLSSLDTPPLRSESCDGVGLGGFKHEKNMKLTSIVRCPWKILWIIGSLNSNFLCKIAFMQIQRRHLLENGFGISQFSKNQKKKKKKKNK